MTEFSKRLRQARLDASITQDELAKKMNVSKSTISMWENGNRTPSVSVLISLADILHTSAGYLSGHTVSVLPTGKAIPGYSYATDTNDPLSALINVALGLDDNQLEQLIKYAEFLNQEAK